MADIPSAPVPLVRCPLTRGTFGPGRPSAAARLLATYVSVVAGALFIVGSISYLAVSF